MRNSWARVLIGAVVLAMSTGCEVGTKPGAEPPTGPALDLSGTGYRLIEGRIPREIADLNVSKLIGADGGSLHLAGHSITVPAGAVEEPTAFTMTLLTNGYVQVELQAVLDGILGLVDVGGSGFGDETVSLSLTYAWAENVNDPSDLLILRMNDDGSVEPLAVTIDETKKTVTAQLEHFSRYCMASN